MKPALLFCLFLSLSAQARLVEKVMARVGEDMISLMELNSYKKRLSDKTVPDTLLFRIASPRFLLLKTDSLLNFLVSKKILENLTETLDFQPSEKQIRQAVKKLRGRRTQKAFAQRLNRTGLSLKTLRKEIILTLKIDFFLTREVISKIIISENDINSFYFNKNRSGLFKHFEYDITSLAFPRTEEGIKKARSARKTLGKMSFEETGRVFSGELKTLRLKTGEMRGAMEKAVQPLSVSDVSHPIPMGDNLYLFRLNWKTPLLTRAEEKTKNKIQKILFERELKKTLEKWLKEKRTGFAVKTFPARETA